MSNARDVAARRYYEWVCKAEIDFGESAFSCSRPEGHEGHHFDWADQRWWSDGGREPPADARWQYDRSPLPTNRGGPVSRTVTPPRRW